ncbi:D-alanyl-D-alanine carboxypeptidase [Lachnospiraceae bacterium MD335]|jgi:D-alanyl-D-alanine carboxypeptidase (penicillin-binding protein 5/6)|nr:D-alanyl-D-alanine carboxypeptidase [Lachnospiraceae bacterium MD335]
MTVSTANNYERDNRAAALRALDELEEAQYSYTAQDEERARRRRERIQEMKRQKEKQLLMRKVAIPALLAAVLIAVSAGMGIKALVGRYQTAAAKRKTEAETQREDAAADKGSAKREKPQMRADFNLAGADITVSFLGMREMQTAFIETHVTRTLGGKSKEPVLFAQADDNTIGSVGDCVSENVVFIDVESGRILAQKDAKMRISPASMTKILTILVAAEHITDADAAFEITTDITDYSFVNHCSNAGFEIGERVTVMDLFYGTILPSGADAAVGLAKYAAGSQEEFVKLMNEKLAELGLSETSHFTNCVGIHEENHYSTVYDMAVILKAAYDNPFCREVLSRRIYTTTPTPEHPEGLTLSNLFLRRIEDRDTHGEVLCAKTGYVDQSGNCAASLSVGNDGRLYICVSAHSQSSGTCIKDHVSFYQYFLP